MRKLLILLIVCLSASLIHAQVPVQISVNPTKFDVPPGPDAACFAGTFTVGQHIGQSNDISPDTIFLCFGDSLLIDHSGNEMFMDPNPATPPGIAYAFYDCPPTATGDDATVLADPCLWPGSLSPTFWATQGPASGDHWFFNTGGILNSTIFCNMNPCMVTFAPMTITDYPNRDLEAGCVDVNINEAFSVVYLKEIEADAIVTNFDNDDCKGKFRLRHGYPGWDLTATYTVNIFLDSDPSIKALIYTPPAQLRHTNNVIFSVPQAGLYTVVVEDGKSCTRTFQINMGGCDPSNSVGLTMPDSVLAPPGTQICIPVTVENFTGITGASFSISWNPFVLTYAGVQNPHPAIEPFSTAGNLNENEAILGNLGFTYSDFLSVTGTTIPDSGVLFEICFTVVGQLGECTPLEFGSFPTIVTMDEISGLQPAINADPGEICAGVNPMDLEFFVNAPNCDNTASIGVIINGGSGPYVFSWQTCAGGGQNQVTANVADTLLTLPLPEGCWIVCVTDQNGFGNQVCDTLDISIPSLGATLIVVQSPSCNGSSDGSVRADVTVDGVIIPNPGANFTFLWNTVPPQTTPTISGIMAGGYSVTVTDVSTGCTQVAAGSLSQPAALTVDIQVTPASCPGIADGTITTTVSGGTPGATGSEYVFEWGYSDVPGGTINSDDSGVGNPFVMTNKLGGVYYVTVTDANGCTYVHPVDIVMPNAREFKVDTIGILDPTCFGLSNGSILIEASANPDFTAPNYLFFWNPSTFQQDNVGSMSTYSGLPAGDYDVVILELNSGCTTGAMFTLTEPPVIDLAANSLSPSCQLQTNGSISIAATGGTGAFSYSWNSDPVVILPPQPNQTNLGPGTYTVTISDANGCLDSLTIPLALPNPPAITSVDSTSVVCGADGCLSVTAPSAVSFSWATLGGTAVGNTQEVCGLAGDTYVVTIQDAQGCVNTDTITLGAITPVFIADSLLTPPTCNGGSDGSIALDIQGGNPGYLYNWSSGQNTPVLFAITAGAYTVTVTDTKGCTLAHTFVLQNPPGIAVQFNNIVPVSCFGVCDGQATLVAFYSTVPPTPADFDFLWSDGSTDSMRVDLCAGFNTVTIRDAVTGCFRIDSIFIGSPPELTATFANDSVSCFGDNDGRSQVTVAGGNGQPYSYLWSNGSTFNTAINLTAGPVTLTVTDNSGCTQVFSTNIEEPTAISITTSLSGTSDPLCFGASDGRIEVIASSGNAGDFTYNWSNSTGPFSTENPLINLAAGPYTVTVTDAKGCTGVQFFTLNNPSPVIGSYLPWDPILCYGEETTLFIDTILGGAGAPYQYSLDFGVYLDPGFPISMGGGEHYVTYIDRTGCEVTDTIFVVEPAEIMVTFDPNVVEIELGDSLLLIPIITGSTVTDFEWTPANLLSNPDTLEPFTRTYESQTYSLVVFDANGCSATGSIEIIIDPNRNVYIPNVFMAGNTRGLNDHFNPNIGRGVEIINYMRIFDRWGSLMYERNSFIPNNNDFAEGWDGRYKGQFVMPGVYVYVIEVKFLDGRVLLYRGDVTVLR